MWALGGRGVTFTVNIITRLAQKLLRNILLHLGLETFKICLRKTRKPIIVIVFGPSGRDDAQNQLYLILETLRYFEKYQKYPIISENVLAGNIKNVNRF